MIEHDTTRNCETITGKPWLRSEDDQVLYLDGTFLTCNKIYTVLLSEILLDHYFVCMRLCIARCGLHLIISYLKGILRENA